MVDVASSVGVLVGFVRKLLVTGWDSHQGLCRASRVEEDFRLSNT